MSPERKISSDIDFHQVDQKSQSIGKLVPQRFVFIKFGFEQDK